MPTIPHQQSPLSMLHMLDDNQDIHPALRKPAISRVAAVERQRSRQSIPINGVHLCGKYRPRRGPRLQKQDPDNGPSALFCQRRKGRPLTPEADPGCPGKWFIDTFFPMAQRGPRLQKQILDALGNGPSGLFCQRRTGRSSTDSGCPGEWSIGTFLPEPKGSAVDSSGKISIGTSLPGRSASSLTRP